MRIIHLASDEASATDMQVQKQIKSLCDCCCGAQETGRAQVTVRKGFTPFMTMAILVFVIT